MKGLMGVAAIALAACSPMVVITAFPTSCRSAPAFRLAADSHKHGNFKRAAAASCRAGSRGTGSRWQRARVARAAAHSIPPAHTEPAALAADKNVLRDKRLVTMGTPEQVWKWLRRTKQIR